MGPLRVFAYGTLVTGARDPAIAALLDQHLLQRRQAWIPGRLYDLGPFPGAQPGHGRIWGEVLVLDAPRICLPALDAYEDCNPRRPLQGMYRRQRVWAREAPPRRRRCWVYWLNRRPPDARLIPHGEYRRWLGAP